MTDAAIKAWSFSRWEVFTKCAWAAFLQYVEKHEPGHDPKREAAFKKGRDAHDWAEQYVRGDLDALPKILQKFQANFERLRKLYAESPSHLVMEEEWGFDAQWQPTDYWGDLIWLRVKLDRMEWLDPERTSAEIVDYKTGRKFGNEVKHNMQGQLYAICAFMLFPELEAVRVIFEYLEEGKPTVKTYSREQAMAMLPAWDRRGKSITQAKAFPPRPNKISCRYCPFGPNKGTGICEYGVEV